VLHLQADEVPSAGGQGETPMKSMFAAIAVAMALAAAPALASSCPMHMQKIDAAIKTAKLSDAQMTEVKKLRADGEALHKAGKHAESVEALTRAEKILGIQ
jgi:hypothetical protein